MCDLSAPHFHDKDLARRHLEETRWPNGPVCPHCGGTEKNHELKGKAHRPGLYKCYDCREQFSVTVGTLFEGSNVGLNKWLMAVHLMCASKKGVSAKQIERMLGVTYKTAWFMAHRIREAMREVDPAPMGGEGSTVEIDETYWGNKGKQRKGARGFAHKEKVLSLVERGAKVRSYHVKAVNAETLKPILKEQIDAATTVYTDDGTHYRTLGNDFINHDTVVHSIGEYVRGDVYTNTIENYFSIFKRGMTGVYQHCGKQHLKRYLCEFDFRYNHREKLGFNDAERATMALRGIDGKRLMYRDSSAM